MVTLIGLIAVFTSTVSLIPQLYQTYKTKSAKDLSILMLINFVICSLSWVIYGILTDSISVLITNIIMTISSIALLIFKLKYQDA